MTPDDLAAIAALAAAATPGPWRAVHTRLERAIVPSSPRAPVVPWSHADALSHDDAAFIAAARTAVPALLAHIATLTAERDEARESLAAALAPNAGDEALDAIAAACGCAEWEYPAQVTRDVLAVTRERDAAVAARDALAGAVHVVRVAFAATTASGAQYGAAWDAVDAMPPTALQSEGIAAALRTSYEAQETLEGALTALLDGAPADVVRGDVVRAYLAAADALPGDLATINAAIDKERAARAALDAALAAGGGR